MSKSQKQFHQIKLNLAVIGPLSKLGPALKIATNTENRMFLKIAITTLFLIGMG